MVCNRNVNSSGKAREAFHKKQWMLFPEEVGPGQRQQYLQGTEHAALQKLSKDVDAVVGGKRRRPRERQRIRARRGKRKEKNKGERRQELGGET